MPLSGWYVFKVKVAEGSFFGFEIVPFGASAEVASVSVDVPFKLLTFLGWEYFVVILVVCGYACMRSED